MLLIPSLKYKTRKSALVSLPDPEDFYLPLSIYGNAQLSPLVTVGQRVLKYQLLASSDGSFAGRLYAPVSGIIKAFFHLEGKPIIHLQNDFTNTQQSLSINHAEQMTATELEKIFLNSGIQGLGGSRFPTHVKYSASSADVDTIIFNGVECEPYLTADFVVMNEKATQLIMAAQVIANVLQVNRVVFAIEKQNKVLKTVLLKSAAKQGANVEVKILPNGYPQGGELQLIKSVTGKEIPKGRIPADYGVLVNNVGTLWAMYSTLFEGKPAIERVVTVSGDACQYPGNYLTKIGTPVSHILRQTGNRWNPDQQTIILGGAMMGKSVDSTLTPIHHGAGGLLIMKRIHTDTNNCIKCGVCVDVCPQRLMPLEFVRHHQQLNIKGLQDYHLKDCIECGACAYVCPSNVPLMESIFDGKVSLFSNSVL